MDSTHSVWQQCLPAILPPEHRILPQGGETAEAIIAMADEWSQLGGRFSMVARNGDSRLKPVYVSDDFCRRFPLAAQDRERFDLGRDTAMANLLGRLAMHAAARCPGAGPTLTQPYLRHVNRRRWCALTCDVAALSIAALDVQLTGDPRVALWYLTTAKCEAERCPCHQPVPVDGRWRWPENETVITLDWLSMPDPRWRLGSGIAARLDPDLPEAQDHPFFNMLSMPLESRF